jgi:hypothetical protein
VGDELMRSGWGIALLTAAAMTAGPAHAQNPPVLPFGWERPTDKDLAGTNWEFRQDKPDRSVRAEGDFNGDGQPDRAELLLDRMTKQYALFVFLAGANAPIELDRGKLDELGRIGIYAGKPGRVKTACGKGYDSRDPKCERGEKFVEMPYAPIAYGQFESGGSHYYWKNGKFIEVWTSD